MKRPNAEKLYNNIILRNCAQLSIENSKRRAGRALYNQAMLESHTRPKVPVIAPALPFKTPYEFPQIHGNLTHHTSWGSSDINKELDSILTVLNTYKIHCEIADINQGPTLTQYVLSPNPGQSVQSLLKREKEFQAALHCNVSLRFDNGYVLLEIPANNSTVYLGDMLIDDKFNSSTAFTMAIGMGVDGSKQYIDIGKACHILISGMTGSGKSIVLHNLIISLLMKQAPDKMHLYHYVLITVMCCLRSPLIIVPYISAICLLMTSSIHLQHLQWPLAWALTAPSNILILVKPATYLFLV